MKQHRERDSVLRERQHVGAIQLRERDSIFRERYSMLERYNSERETAC